MNKTFSVCVKCKHHRRKSIPELFSITDLQSPLVLKSKLEWEQQNNERRLMELHRFESGHPFIYEPYYYSWCAAYTPFNEKLYDDIRNAQLEDNSELISGLTKRLTAGWDLISSARNGDYFALQKLVEHNCAVMNPVTGEIAPVYALCANVNPDGQCPLYEQI